MNKTVYLRIWFVFSLLIFAISFISKFVGYDFEIPDPFGKLIATMYRGTIDKLFELGLGSTVFLALSQAICTLLVVSSVTYILGHAFAWIFSSYKKSRAN